MVFPDREKYGLKYSDEFVDIIEKLLTKDPKKRLGTKGGIQEILSHPWFADINMKDLLA